MNIKVKFEELRDIGKNTEKFSTSLEEEIERLLKALDELKSIWQGDDADVFYKNAGEYINRMKILPAFQSSMANFIKDSSNQYEDNDKEFSDKLRKEKEEIEQDSNFGFSKVQPDNSDI